MSAKMIVTDDALHAAREVMELAGYFSPMPETWDKAFRAMANAMPAPVSVKALEWWEPDHTNNYTHGAETIIGTYYVHIDGGRHMGCMETFVNDKIEQWEGPERGSLYQAQNDAQADYERRVLSALDPMEKL
jgi:hypothetical protein